MNLFRPVAPAVLHGTASAWPAMLLLATMLIAGALMTRRGRLGWRLGAIALVGGCALIGGEAMLDGAWMAIAVSP